MMYRLIRIASDDYRNFRRAYSKIEYSFFKKGEEQPHISATIRKMTQSSIKGKGEFLDHVENPNNESYFFEVDGNIEGIAELIFKDKGCHIYQFSVFQHGKGWGTILYNEVLKIIKEHGCKRINLWCPYEGAQIFWKKQGFSFRQKDFFEKKI